MQKDKTISLATFRPCIDEKVAMNSTIKSGILALLTLATTSYASLTMQSGENDLLTWLCLAFVGLLVGCQMLPGLTRLIRLGDMVQNNEKRS